MDIYKVYQIVTIITSDKRKKKELNYNYVIIEFYYRINNKSFISKDLDTDKILYKIVMKTQKEVYLVLDVKSAWIVNDEYLFFITKQGDIYKLKDTKYLSIKE